MRFYTLCIVALALSLDAFGVAVCIGLNNYARFKNKMSFAISFGFFQFLFAFLGAVIGFLFNKYIASVPSVIGGIIIAIVGVMMIKEGFENKGECPLISPKMYIVLGISVSIDAMVVGFTVMNSIPSTWIILSNSIFIGIVTFILSCGAFFIARYLKKIELISKYADYIGGIILIIFGLKMIFS